MVRAGSDLSNPLHGNGVRVREGAFWSLALEFHPANGRSKMALGRPPPSAFQRVG